MHVKKYTSPQPIVKYDCRVAPARGVTLLLAAHFLSQRVEVMLFNRKSRGYDSDQNGFEGFPSLLSPQRRTFRREHSWLKAAIRSPRES